jgi:hypothetical protein
MIRESLAHAAEVFTCQKSSRLIAPDADVVHAMAAQLPDLFHDHLQRHGVRFVESAATLSAGRILSASRDHGPCAFQAATSLRASPCGHCSVPRGRGMGEGRSAQNRHLQTANRRYFIDFYIFFRVFRLPLGTWLWQPLAGILRNQASTKIKERPELRHFTRAGIDVGIYN